MERESTLCAKLARRLSCDDLISWDAEVLTEGQRTSTKHRRFDAGNAVIFTNAEVTAVESGGEKIGGSRVRPPHRLEAVEGLTQREGTSEGFEKDAILRRPGRERYRIWNLFCSSRLL